MKKTLLSLFGVILFSGAFAQLDSTNNRRGMPNTNERNDNIRNNNIDLNKHQNHEINPNNKTQPIQDSKMDENKMDKHTDGYMMKNGRMVIVKNGKMTNLEKEITLSNGTRVMTNGNYIKRGGTKTMFKEGEHIDMTGKIIPMN